MFISKNYCYRKKQYTHIQFTTYMYFIFLKVLSVTLSYGPNDGSDVRLIVEVRSPLFMDIEKVVNDLEASELIKTLDLDILVDITSHTYNGRKGIIALKPAPVVINYLGFPGTSGCPEADYSMVDSNVVSPESTKNLFNERLIYLPYSYQVNSMPFEVAPVLWGQNKSKDIDGINNANDPPKEPIEKISRTITDHIISLNNRVKLCSFNANKKMEPTSFSVWMNVMRSEPATVLVLLDMAHDAKRNIIREAQYQGILPSRLFFVPTLSWECHLERVSKICDYVVDTFVYGAHTTASDMLWMSIPVITLQSWGSGRMPSKVASSIISSIQRISLDNNNGIADEKSTYDTIVSDVTVTYSVRAYESMALSLCKSPSAVIRLKNLILSLTLIAPTFNTYIMQESIEHAYQAAQEVLTLSPPTVRIRDSNPSGEIEGDSGTVPYSDKKKFHIVIGKPNISIDLDSNRKYSIKENTLISCLEEFIIALFENNVYYDDDFVPYETKFCSLLSESNEDMMNVLSLPMATRIRASLPLFSTHSPSEKPLLSTITRILRYSFVL